MTAESFIRSLENAFRPLGEVPRTFVFDNAKAVVSHADRHDPELKTKIVAFCKHSNFALLCGSVELGYGSLRVAF